MTDPTIYTRAAYLADAAQPGAFARYYGEIIADAGGPQAFAKLLPASLETIRAALAAGDLHLNTIRLTSWDAKAWHVSPMVSAALRARGDYPTMANCVCVLKEAARLLAEGGAQ